MASAKDCEFSFDFVLCSLSENEDLLLIEKRDLTLPMRASRGRTHPKSGPNVGRQAVTMDAQASI